MHVQFVLSKTMYSCGVKQLIAQMIDTGGFFLNLEIFTSIQDTSDFPTRVVASPYCVITNAIM